MGVSELSDKGHCIFDNTPCVLVGFEFNFRKKEEFGFEDFIKETEWEGRKRFQNICGTKYKSSDYHVHLRWRITPPHSLFVAVEFGVGYEAPDENEEEPFAENFLEWFKRFIIAKEIAVETYANFDFPVDPNRKFRFPLPMKAPIGPGQVEAEIDGISFTLYPPVQGIEKIWVTQGKKEVNLHIHARKMMEVSSIGPRKEILETSKIMESLFERKELEQK